METDDTVDVGETTPAVAFRERLRVDVEMICKLFDSGVEVDGDASLVGGTTWVIYGRTTYDGEMILAEYDDAEEAAAVLRSLPPRVRGDRS